MCAVYGIPGNLTPKQMLYLSLNITTAKMIKAEINVIAGDVLAGNPPDAWYEYAGGDKLHDKLLRMMNR